MFRAHAESRVSNRLNPELSSSCSCTEKYIQNYVKIPVLESILKKTVGYVLSESNQLRKKSDVRHYILDALSLKVTAPDLLAAVGVLNVNPRKLMKENYSLQLLTELLSSFNNNSSTVKPKMIQTPDIIYLYFFNSVCGTL